MPKKKKKKWFLSSLKKKKKQDSRKLIWRVEKIQVLDGWSRSAVANLLDLTDHQ